MIRRQSHGRKRHRRCVDEVVGAVKNAIKLAGISGDRRGRDLRVDFDPADPATRWRPLTAGGGVDFRVPFLGMKLSVGGAVTRRDTHTVDIVLVPPGSHGAARYRDGDVETVLLDAIETIRAVMARAVGGDDPFLLGGSTVELSFAVTKDGSITLGFNGEFKDEVTHTLRIGIRPAD